MEVTSLWGDIGKNNNKLELKITTPEERERREKLYNTTRKDCKHPKEYVEGFKGVKVCRICGKMVHDRDLLED